MSKTLPNSKLIKIQTEACPVCGSRYCKYQRKYRGKSKEFHEKSMFSCKKCCGVFISPMPSEPELTEYNISYFAKAHGRKTDSSQEGVFFRGIARLRLAHMLHQNKNLFMGAESVLEVGPGEGYLGQVILERWKKIQYFGIETDTSCYPALKEKGIKVLVQNDALPQVDLLILSHVLEHVPRPVEFLGHFSASLKSKGSLFIEVPCQDHLHKPVDEPHLLFFDKPSMMVLLKKIGFHEIRLSYHGQYIRDLVRPSLVRTFVQALRTRLIQKGLVAPFATHEPGLEGLNPKERAAVKPWKAHRESEEPAWWLRAMAIKP